MNIVKLTKSNIPFAGITADINSIKKLPVIDINLFINTDIPLYVYEFSYYLNNIYNDEDDEEVAILKIVMSDNGNYKCLHIYCREESISLKEVKEKYL